VSSRLDSEFKPHAPLWYPFIIFTQVCIGFFTTDTMTNYDAHLTVLYCNRLSFLLSNTMIPTVSDIYDICI
jgi:hypothetical protein